MTSTIIPASHLDLLEKPLLAHVATIGPNGEPQSNPVWYLWEDQQLLLAVGPDGQKAKNLQRDSRIALSLADPDNPIHYLEIRGTASVDRVATSQDPAVIALVRKYTGQDTYDGMPDEHAVVVVEPTRVTSLG